MRPFLLMSPLPARADDPAVTVCERIVQAFMKSPTSFKRAAASIDGPVVSISFDAQNSFGALLRGAGECQFAMDDDGYSVRTVRIDGRFMDHRVVTAVALETNLKNWKRAAIDPNITVLKEGN